MQSLVGWWWLPLRTRGGGHSSPVRAQLTLAVMCAAAAAKEVGRSVRQSMAVAAARCSAALGGEAAVPAAEDEDAEQGGHRLGLTLTQRCIWICIHVYMPLCMYTDSAPGRRPIPAFGLAHNKLLQPAVAGAPVRGLAPFDPTDQPGSLCPPAPAQGRCQHRVQRARLCLPRPPNLD